MLEKTDVTGGGNQHRELNQQRMNASIKQFRQGVLLTGIGYIFGSQKLLDRHVFMDEVDEMQKVFGKGL